MGMKLTFAELYYLLGSDHSWPSLSALLDVPEPSPQVAAAGVSSLLARNLARVDGGDLTVETPVQFSAGLLLRPARSIGILRADQSGLGGALVFLPLSGAPSVQVGLDAPGVYDIVPFKEHSDPVAQLAEMCVELAVDSGSAISFMDSSIPSAAAPWVITHMNGIWRLRQEGEEHATLESGDREAVLNFVSKQLNFLIKSE